MNKKPYHFWLRFILFFVAFSVAFFLLMFLLDRNLSQNLRMLLFKVEILAAASSLLYNMFVETDPEVVD